MNNIFILKPQTIHRIRRFENSKTTFENFKTCDETLVLNCETPIDNILKPSTGSNRCGVFEVQTDEGIFRHAKYKKIDNSTDRKRNKIWFKTWEQMIDEEKQNGQVVWSSDDSISKFERVEHDLPIHIC